MEKEFFELYESQSCLSFEIGHNSIADWILIIMDTKGVGLQKAVQVCQIQDCSRSLVFAKAYCELAEYLCENRGGY